MIKGIDISSWQEGIVPSKLGIDFCIIKATEGNTYLNPSFHKWIKDCTDHNILYGFYHYYNHHCSAKENAYWFWKNVKQYTGKGIAVLDYEEWQGNDASMCEIFMDEYYKLSKVWPMLYISASNCCAFIGSGVPDRCKLWVAGYPRDYATWPKVTQCPYSVKPWKSFDIWQFASDWQMSGYVGLLDANVSNLSRKGWMQIARGDSSKNEVPEYMPSCLELAQEVLEGKWGNGQERIDRLDGTFGEGTYTHVQEIVNRLVEG